jgi:hypothetical protein
LNKRDVSFPAATRSTVEDRAEREPLCQYIPRNPFSAATNRNFEVFEPVDFLAVRLPLARGS